MAFLEEAVPEDVPVEEMDEANAAAQFTVIAAVGGFLGGSDFDHEDLDGPLLPAEVGRPELNGERDPRFLGEPFAVPQECGLEFGIEQSIAHVSPRSVAIN